MEFRYPVAVAEANTRALNTLTKNLNDSEAGREVFNKILIELGNSVERYPNWHPILTLPPHKHQKTASSISELKAYAGIDHTVLFVKGFVTCPYSEDEANQLVKSVNAIQGLFAERLQTPLYSDYAYPVVIQASDIELEADGTIRSRDALAWCTQHLVKNAQNAEVAETWWSMRSCILGHPHGSRSSLLVNQHTGGHMRKILEALNNSGMYGPIREWSLEMLSEKKRKAISETLIRTAINCWEKSCNNFEFELRGETCKAEIRDTWNDGDELSVRVMIGDYDLCVSGFSILKKISYNLATQMANVH
ncbi:hypothetical protein L2719_06955 [Shewanella schlegeliana]|uniref:Uncharacterized protein n=1 Tax=Shewanella schlegeliana TaxID=190308 RepID=A0ABS1T1A9_9GAMM|nr:hypothetical protein [Shewanella schlegeliana]MBL4913326.1 hypothetical protein [Shewanella schlegeliana]MCL1109281.1 hypothetical protein [Shewanella schlegeliana]GIU24710.1 hypothetical protein TUM4433_08680 [Shewanella schlegeliana]